MEELKTILAMVYVNVPPEELKKLIEAFADFFGYDKDTGSYFVNIENPKKQQELFDRLQGAKVLLNKYHIGMTAAGLFVLTISMAIVRPIFYPVWAAAALLWRNMYLAFLLVLMYILYQNYYEPQRAQQSQT